MKYFNLTVHNINVLLKNRKHQKYLQPHKEIVVEQKSNKTIFIISYNKQKSLILQQKQTI